jgi:predicted phosphodiesterase
MSRTSSVERVAALYDIHGNLPALEAVLDAVALARVSTVVVGGDVVLGPMPGPVLDRLATLAMPVLFLRGNCDRLVSDAASGTLSDRLPAPVRDSVEWTAAQLSAEQLRMLAPLPTTVRVEIADRAGVRFCHATPRSDEEIVTPTTPDTDVTAMLAGTEESSIVCGHTHVQFRRQVGAWELVNAGSVGMSTGAAEAHWLLLDTVSTWQRTPYDPERAAERIAATSFPGAQAFVDAHVRQAPAPEAMWARLDPRVLNERATGTSH